MQAMGDMTGSDAIMSYAVFRGTYPGLLAMLALEMDVILDCFRFSLASTTGTTAFFS